MSLICAAAGAMAFAKEVSVRVICGPAVTIVLFTEEVPECPTKVSGQSFPQECQVRAPYKSAKGECPTTRASVLQECPTKVSRKSAPEECHVRVSYKSVESDCPTTMSGKSVPGECQVRAPRKVSSKSVLQRWEVRAPCMRVKSARLTHVSRKRVKSERPTKVSSKSVLQVCQVSLSYTCDT